MQNKSDMELVVRQVYLTDLLEKNKENISKDDLFKIDVELKIIDMILNPTVPELWLNKEVTSFFDFDNSKELKDVKVLNYKHMGKVKFPIAQ